MGNGDDYARKYMGGDRVRFLDKVRIPKWMHALLLGSGVLATIAVAFAGAPEAMPVVVVPTLLAWGLLSAIRVAVTDTHVHVQYGVFGPQIALDDIVSAVVEDYQWARFGGWGIRRALDGAWAFSVPGRGGKAVRIRYRAGDKVKDVVVSSENATALATAIHEAASARGLRNLEDLSTAAPSQADAVEEAVVEQHVEEHVDMRR
jgi:hypothetical protein